MPDKATSQDKQARLAEALRANLKRRKAQAKARVEPAQPDSSADPGTDTKTP